MNRLNLFVLLLGMLLALPSCQKETADPSKPTEAELEQAQEQIDTFIRDLQAPQESYLVNWPALGEINTIRRQAFQMYGIEWIYPWGSIKQLGGPGQTITSKVKPNPIASLPKNDKLPYDALRRTSDYDGNTSPEHVWLNRSMHACGAIASLLRSEGPGNIAYRTLLNPNSELWKKQVRPLLLLQSQAPRYGITACDALVAGGERSEYLKQRLIHFFRRRPGSYGYDKAAKLMTECGWGVPTKYPTFEEIPVLQVEPAMKKKLATREGRHPHGAIATNISVIEKGRKIELRLLGGGKKHGQYIQFDLVDKSITEVKNTIRGRNRVSATGPRGEFVSVEYVPTGKTGGTPEVMYDAFLVFRERKTGTVRWRTPLMNTYITSLQISPSARVVAFEHRSSSEKRKLLVYRAHDGQLLFRQSAAGVSRVHFHSIPYALQGEDTRWRFPTTVALKTIGYSTRVLIGWNGHMVPREYNPLVNNSALAVTPDGKRTVTISDGYFVHWYLGRDDKVGSPPQLKRYRIQTVLPRKPYFLGFGFTPGEKYLASGLRNTTSVAFWTPEGKCVGRLSLAKDKGKELVEVRWVGDKLLALSYNGELTVWNWADIAAAIQKQKAL